MKLEKNGPQNDFQDLNSQAPCGSRVAFRLAFAILTAPIFFSIFRLSASSLAISCSGVSISLFGTARTALANRLKRTCGELSYSGSAGNILRGILHLAWIGNGGPVKRPLLQKRIWELV